MNPEPGGYYTQKDICEILEYARQHYMTVIPEIEMPSHSEEVLAAYPQLSCSGEPYKNSDFCVGNEETFTFLENVLTEVMELFRQNISISVVMRLASRHGKRARSVKRE